MAVTKAGLIVPDHSIPTPEPPVKAEVRWNAHDVEAFEQASRVLIANGITFMAMCPECGKAGRNAMMSAMGDGSGTIFVECDCTVHILMGPKARKNVRKAERREQ